MWNDLKQKIDRLEAYRELLKKLEAESAHVQATGLYGSARFLVVADAEGAVGAPSVHFGFPLWFFNRAQVDSIADVIFDEWQIGRY